ncbi:MAG: SGNH/GDSL hydrolase family protein, partial [Myxococcota bacterium]|nr:SGNH/GDSL hydrolase family protein [Myxococcota bacterium]
LVSLVGILGWFLLLRRRPDCRKILFRIGAVSLAPLLVVLLETALLLAGVQPSAEVTPGFDPSRVAGPIYEFQDLEGVACALPLAPVRQRILRVAKAPGQRRVVALGESSTYGAEYLAEETFSAVLERRLGDSVQVINGGVGGALSDEIRSTGIQMLDLDPDLLILYFGYNDLVMLPHIAGFQAYEPSGLTLRHQLSRSRLVRVLRDLLPESVLEVAAKASPEDAFRDEQPPSPKSLESVTALAESRVLDNQVRLIRAAREQGVPTLIVVQAQNQVLCPEEGMGEQDETCQSATLRRIALAAAERTGAPLLDAPAALQAHAGTPAGHEYFWDSIHPTRLGHAVLGEALAPAVARLLEDGSE